MLKFLIPLIVCLFLLAACAAEPASPSVVAEPTAAPTIKQLSGNSDFLIDFDPSQFTDLEPADKLEKLKIVLEEKYQSCFLLNFQYSQQHKSLHSLVILRQDITLEERDKIARTLFVFPSYLVAPAENIIMIAYPQGRVEAFVLSPAISSTFSIDDSNQQVRNNKEFISSLISSPRPAFFIPLQNLTDASSPYWLKDYTPKVIVIDFSLLGEASSPERKAQIFIEELKKSIVPNFSVTILSYNEASGTAELFLEVFLGESEETQKKTEDIIYTVFTVVFQHTDLKRVSITTLFADGKIRIFNSSDVQQIKIDPSNWRNFIEIIQGSIIIHFPK